MALSKSQKGSMMSDFCKLLESGEGADLTFVVGESQVPAHSLVLAARSPVFAAMFQNHMVVANRRPIQIKDMGEPALQQLLSFLYTDSAPQLHSVVLELLAAADTFDLPLLKERCEQEMERVMCVENAAAIARFAVLHRCPGLRSAAVQFIAGHPEVMATEIWHKLKRINADAVLEISMLVAQESCATRQSAPPSRFVSRELRQKLATNLLEAVQKGAVREVWALMTAGAPKDAIDTDKNTALHLAAGREDITTVKCLLHLGLDVNAVNRRNQTPLHLAATEMNSDVIWMLVAASAQINAQDEQGQTPLHVAAQTERPFCVTELKAEVAEKCKLKMVETLLLAGARKDIKDRNGKTPEQVATPYTKSAFSTTFSP